MGNWYRVIKTIKGNRYLYEQQTFREDGRVKTRNRYLGRADRGSGSSGRLAITAGSQIPATEEQPLQLKTKSGRVTDAYPPYFLGFNMEWLENEAKRQGYNLYDALIKRVDSQDNLPDKIRAMHEIHAELLRGESAEAADSLPSIAGAVTTTPNGADPVTSVPRHWKDYSGEDTRITSPQSAVAAFRDLLKNEDPIERDKEHYYVMHLDARSKIKMIELVHLGTLTSSVVHPRETFRRAIAAGSYAIIIAHNHPSGEVDPSEEDIKMTKLMYEAGQIVGIDVRDHIVFSETKAWSFKKNGEIV